MRIRPSELFFLRNAIITSPTWGTERTYRVVDIRTALGAIHIRRVEIVDPPYRGGTFSNWAHFERWLIEYDMKVLLHAP